MAEATWAKEAVKWDHLKLLRVIPVLGHLTKRIKALNTPADIYVINRENVPWLVEYMCKYESRRLLGASGLYNSNCACDS